MAGKLKLDESGVASLVRELHVHGAGSGEHAAQADAALAAAVGAVSSAPLAGAVEQLAARFRGGFDDIGVRMISLGGALTAASSALIATDAELAGSARSMSE
jgi:hypothetical protein